jgi:hypothetical protein
MIQIMYAPREQQDAQEYSEVLGYRMDGVSKGTSRAMRIHHQHENVSDQKERLCFPRMREIGWIGSLC